MKKLIIHIGPHKTASTFIQAHMVLNESLLNEASICYPKELRIPPGHQKILPTLHSNDHAQFDAALSEMSEFETTFLSTENLTRATDSEIKALLKVFEGYDIQVLFYYRRAHELWPSHWQETIKQGGYDHWPTYLMNIMGFVEKSTLQFIRPLGVMRRWGKVLGAERLNIFPYDAITKDPRDALRPVCKLINFDVDKLRIDELGRNASYDPVRVEAMRSLNQLHSNLGNKKSDQIRRMYMKNAVQLESSDVFNTFKSHFEKNSMISTLTKKSSYLALDDRIFTREFQHNFMKLQPSQENAERVIRFANPAFPAPESLIEGMRTMLLDAESKRVQNQRLASGRIAS